MEGFDAACFNRKYVTGTVSEEYLHKQGLSRSDKKKSQNEPNRTVIELHNTN
jgi:hypothetical protein